MQITYNPSRASRFWVALACVMLCIALIWMAMTLYDRTLAHARQHLSTVSLVTAKIGAVTDTTLYKTRLGDIETGAQPCFAEYFFYVTGQSGMDCDPGMKYTELAFAWAKKAADIGDAEDKRVYQGLVDIENAATRPKK